MSPGKLATWRDPEGNDRLLVVDQAGPTNTSEWSADGKLLAPVRRAADELQ